MEPRSLRLWVAMTSPGKTSLSDLVARMDVRCATNIWRVPGNHVRITLAANKQVAIPAALFAMLLWPRKRDFSAISPLLLRPVGC